MPARHVKFTRCCLTQWILKHSGRGRGVLTKPLLTYHCNIVTTLFIHYSLHSLHTIRGGDTLGSNLIKSPPVLGKYHKVTPVWQLVGVPPLGIPCWNVAVVTSCTDTCWIWMGINGSNYKNRNVASRGINEGSCSHYLNPWHAGRSLKGKCS